MGPSVRQLRLLSPEDRVLYKQWLCRGLWFYASLAVLLVGTVVVNHLRSPASLDVASGSGRPAVIAATK